MEIVKLPLVSSKYTEKTVSKDVGHFLDLSMKLNTKGPAYVLVKVNKYMNNSVPGLRELFVLVKETAEAYRPPSDPNFCPAKHMAIFSSDMAKHFDQTKRELQSLWKQHVKTYEEVQRLQKEYVQREKDIEKFHAILQDKLTRPDHTDAGTKEAELRTKHLEKMYRDLHSKKQYKMIKRYNDMLVSERTLRLKLKQVAMELYDDVKETLKHRLGQGLRNLRRVADLENNSKLASYEPEHLVGQIMDVLCGSYKVQRPPGEGA